MPSQIACGLLFRRPQRVVIIPWTAMPLKPLNPRSPVWSYMILQKVPSCTLQTRGKPSTAWDRNTTLVIPPSCKADMNGWMAPYCLLDPTLYQLTSHLPLTVTSQTSRVQAFAEKHNSEVLQVRWKQNKKIFQHNWPLQRSTWQLFRCSLPTASPVWWSCRIGELQWIINLLNEGPARLALKGKQNKRSPDAVVSRLIRSFYKDRNFGKMTHSNTLLLYIRPSESAHKGMAPPRDWSAPSFRSRWATNLCSCKELAASFSEQ